MRFNKFEEIDVWKKGMELCNEMYELSRRKSFAKDFELTNQLRRSAISIPSNIAEGFERNSKPEFIRFLKIAKGSAGELRTQLYIARDQEYVSTEQFQELYKKVSEVSKMIAGLIDYLTD